MGSAREKLFLDAYDKHAAALYRHVFFRVFSEARAEELVQETFMKTWEYLRQGKEVDNLKAFLYRVAGNLIIDESRKRKEASLEAVLSNSPGLEPRFDGYKKIEALLVSDEIRTVLEKLPPDTRQLITLRYIDEFEPKEIAQIMEITPNNVSVKIHRALELLREYIVD